MSEHLPIQRWTKIFTRYPASEVLPNESGEYVTYADHLAALHDCKLTHAIRGLKDVNRIAARGYDDGQRDALADARRIVAGFLDIDPDTGDRRCSDPACDLCVVAPLIYAALEDLSAGGQP